MTLTDSASGPATSRAGRSHELVAVTSMMVLTFVTGIVDAVGYIGLDRVFTGNMTGNIVILGMAVAGADDLPVLGPLIALGAFTLGALVSGVILRGSPKRWLTTSTGLLTAGGLVLIAMASAMFALGDGLTGTQQIVFAASTALVMGEQAAVARALAIRDMTTVVVTSTLTSLASESMVGQGVSSTLERLWNRRFAAIAVIFLGAVAGAGLLLIHIGVAMLLGGLLTLAVAGTGHYFLRPAVR